MWKKKSLKMVNEIYELWYYTYTLNNTHFKKLAYKCKKLVLEKYMIIRLVTFNYDMLHIYGISYMEQQEKNSNLCFIHKIKTNLIYFKN